MSDLWLLLALVATFAAVFSAGLAVEISRARRRRSVELLQSQVASESLPIANMREQDLARPLSDRVVYPILTGLGSAARRITPLDMRHRIARKLVLAGSPEAWDADRVAMFKVLGLVLGAAVGFFVGKLFNLQGLTFFGFIALVTFAGYNAPDTVLNRAAEDRQNAIRKSLADTIDLLTISVEAGLGFDAALAQVVQHVPGPLAHEIARMLQEVQLGVSRQDAFRHLGERNDVEELSSFLLSMIQADIFGVSVSKVLRAQAKELRTRRRQRAERTAMQIPVKILFPMILCVLPALFVVVIGPGAIRIFQSFFQSGGL